MVLLPTAMRLAKQTSAVKVPLRSPVFGFKCVAFIVEQTIYVDGGLSAGSDCGERGTTRTADARF
jgi:hypothetical protein